MLTLEQVLARAMKTSRGPTARGSSLKIDRNLQNIPQDKLSARLNFVRPLASREPKDGFANFLGMKDAEPELAPKQQTLAPNGVDLSLSLKSARILGDWRGAFSVLTSALFSKFSYRPNEDHLKQFITILKRADKLDVVLPMLTNYDANLKSEHSESDIGSAAKTSDPSVESQTTKEQLYHLLMRAHADSKNWMKALDVLTDMLEKNHVLPKTETMNIVLSSMDDGVHWERALSVLSQMLKAKNVQEGKVSFIEGDAGEVSLFSVYDNALPNTVTYATVISMLEAAGKYDLAHKMMKEIPREDREAIMRSYAAVIHLWSSQHHRSGKKHGRIL
ncbi:hypothetical protein XU18_2873 [Perkinsela sp. CCAP 1560/4]|nr:hypothetical protein XU18_2873 [Perkinsela sp. CCAP 1560/4]|eukprot:KNH06368.1 hypothetical protein XU18_2873 [Perkinsela sp. CCAP 1560/4]